MFIVLNKKNQIFYDFVTIDKLIAKRTMCVTLNCKDSMASSKLVLTVIIHLPLSAGIK